MMTRDRPLELLPHDEQVKRLRAFLYTCKSRLRPYLALFAMKNYLMQEAGLKKQEPTVHWYQGKLIRAGVIASYWAVRRQLNRLAKFGVVDRSQTSRYVFCRWRGKPGLRKRRVCQYRLNEAIFPALEQAVKQALTVDAFNKVANEDWNI